MIDQSISLNIAQMMKRIVNGNNHDPLKFYMGQVLMDSECSGIYNPQVGRSFCFDPTNLVIAIKVINDESAEGSYDPNYPDEVPTIYPSVRLMSGIEDGPYVIPSQGSNVIIAVSTWLDPIIIQTSAVDYYSNTSISYDGSSSLLNLSNAGSNTFVLTNNDTSGPTGPIPKAGTIIQQNNNQIVLAATDDLSITQTAIPGSLNITYLDDGGTQYIQNSTSLNLNYNQPNQSIPYSYVQVLDQGVIAGYDQTRIEIAETISLKNSSASLANILTNILGALNDISTALTTITYAPGPGSPVPLITASSVPSISTIQTNINQITSDVNSLLTP